jgi:hypothetical protein
MPDDGDDQMEERARMSHIPAFVSNLKKPQNSGRFCSITCGPQQVTGFIQSGWPVAKLDRDLGLRMRGLRDKAPYMPPEYV